MSPEDQYKTPFSHQYSHYEYLRMRFGLKSAGATFQSLMNSVLMGIQGIRAFVYLDDIVIFASNLRKHNLKLIEIFERLRKFNLKLRPEKCKFLKKEICYLGHKITERGTLPDKEKVEVIKNYPHPKNQKDVRSFLDFVQYYRRLIKDFSKIASPISNLLKKNVPFEWTDRCQVVLDELRNILTSPPILSYPNFKEPFVLTTDASGYAIGSVLFQGKIGEDLPIANASRSLNKVERNYSTCEKELLSIVWSCNHFRPYLFGRKFTILSDNRALVYLKNIKTPKSRHTRMRLKLEEYDYEIIYKPGRLNKNADVLSRIEWNTPTLTWKDCQNKDSVKNELVTKIEGDLFKAPEEFSLVHCVSSDLHMNAGIAKEFNAKFGRVNKLESQHPKKRSFIYLIEKNIFIFYLVTKNKYFEKPTYTDLFDSLKNLKEFCIINNVDKLAMPFIRLWFRRTKRR